jgi:hypothetical protein
MVVEMFYRYYIDKTFALSLQHCPIQYFVTLPLVIIIGSRVTVATLFYDTPISTYLM